MKDLKYYMQSKFVFFIIIAILGITNIYMAYLYKNKENVIDCPICENIIKEKEEINDTIIVDIKGKVKKPGVYTLNSTSIVNDLINAAGGLAKDGSTDTINLSKKLNNEDVVIIPSKVEAKKASTKIVSSANITTKTNTKYNVSSANEKEEVKEEKNKLVNLNSATVEELMTLSGIGEKKALSIIEYRNKTPFTKIDDILNISGIGDSIFAKIKDSITVE